MYELAQLQRYFVSQDGTGLEIFIPNKNLQELIISKRIRNFEVRFDDGRTISAEQRKKAYATMADISLHTGYMPEECKEWLKYLHISKTGCDYFSLRDCTMDTAREFINTIIEYAIENGVQLMDSGINRTDDTDKYLFYCLKHKKCAVCGQKGEHHHEDTIGMGNNRNKLDDSYHKKICLCRKHHTECHAIGTIIFNEKYHVYGIIFKDS